MKYLENFQKLLPIGYLLLVIIGISEESIFYGQLGINIMRYSTIMDILMSPIAILAGNVVPFITLVFVAILSVALFKLLPKYFHKAFVRKMLGVKGGKEWTEAELSEKLMWWVSRNYIFLVMGFFFGIGVGEGNFTVTKIRQDKITYDRKLTFNS